MVDIIICIGDRVENIDNTYIHKYMQYIEYNPNQFLSRLEFLYLLVLFTTGFKYGSSTTGLHFLSLMLLLGVLLTNQVENLGRLMAFLAIFFTDSQPSSV